MAKYKQLTREDRVSIESALDRRVEITDDAVAWIIDIACQRPVDLGYAQELWTLKNLHKYIQEHAQEAGYPRLITITKPMVAEDTPVYGKE